MRTIFFVILLPSMVFAVSQKYKYPYPRGMDDEMQNIYSNIPNKPTTPSIYQSSGAPAFSPVKIGDIDISTTTGKVYISTATGTSGSWVVVN